MKRDMELVRKLLEHGEKNSGWPVSFEGYSEPEYRHHRWLIAEAGLWDKEKSALTWVGHDMLAELKLMEGDR